MEVKIDIYELAQKLNDKEYNNLIVELFANANDDSHVALLKRMWRYVVDADKEEFIRHLNTNRSEKYNFPSPITTDATDDIKIANMADEVFEANDYVNNISEVSDSDWETPLWDKEKMLDAIENGIKRGLQEFRKI